MQVGVKAAAVSRHPNKSNHTAMYLDRDGKVQSVHFRVPEPKKPKKKSAAEDGAGEIVVSRPRPDVTWSGFQKIGDYRTDALHEALGRASIEDHTFMALLVVAFAAQNVRVDSCSGGDFRYGQRFGRLAAMLFDAEGRLAFDMETWRLAARLALIEVFSCRENATKSGIVACLAGEAISADSFLPNMGNDDFLSCLSRPVLEAACKEASVSLGKTLRETRASLVKHFATNRFVHPAALFAPEPDKVAEWLSSNTIVEEEKEPANAPDNSDAVGEQAKAVADADKAAEFREAAE